MSGDITRDAIERTETVVGLEVHVRLQTRTKLFCRCENRYGQPPNTLVCPTCAGLPGALPVLNLAAVQLGVRAGLSLDCEIPPLTKWDRKQYFYPDSPKGYQISQFDLPLCGAGYIDVPAGPTDASGDDPRSDSGANRRIGIIRAHLEEDAGKNTHEGVSGGQSRVDLNRCGTPLLEIVSAPDIQSAAQADAYLNELKSRMTHLGVSDCEMQQGSLRVDVNVNVRITANGQTIATPIAEVKNLNSFRSVRLAIQHETERQIDQWLNDGLTIEQSGKTTRGWDDDAERSFLQREKEESADYRYFPDPDLLPVRLPASVIDEIRDAMPELPAAAIDRLQSQYHLKTAEAEIIVGGGSAMISYFETVAKTSGDARRAAAWMTGEVLNQIKRAGVSIDDFVVDAETTGDLIRRVVAGEIDNGRARDVMIHLIESPGNDAPNNAADKIVAAMKALGIEAVDDSAVETLCQALLDANPKVVQDYREGRKQAIGSLIGQARKQNPNANSKTVRETLIRLIEN